MCPRRSKLDLELQINAYAKHMARWFPWNILGPDNTGYSKLKAWKSSFFSFGPLKYMVPACFQGNHFRWQQPYGSIHSGKVFCATWAPKITCALPHHHLIRTMCIRYVWVRGTLWDGAMSNSVRWCDRSCEENEHFDCLMVMKPKQ